MLEPLSSELLSATKGDYSIPIFAIFAQAWHCIKGIKKALWGGFFLFLIIIVSLYIFFGLLLTVCNILHFYHLRVLCQFFAGGVISIFHISLSISLIFLALRHLRHQAIRANMVFEVRKNWEPLALISIAIYLLNEIFFLGACFILQKLIDSGSQHVLLIGELILIALFVVLYMYLTLLVTMTMLLIIDKKMQLRDSLKIACISINQHWVVNIVLLMLASLLLMLMSGITLGIGLIWFFPLFFLIPAIQYQQIFCKGNVSRN